MQRANTRLNALITCLGALLALAATSKSWGATVAESAEKPRSVVILGASYAKGWETPALPGFERVINRGVGGEETGDMRKRFPADVAAARPDAVLIWGHVNNITRAAPDQVEAAKAAAKADYDEMLRQARAAGIRVILATEVPWTAESGIVATVYGWIASLRGKTSYAERTSAHVEEVNEHVRALARRDRLQLLDFGRTFANDDGTRKQEYAAEDGSHISAAGYKALTDYATRELRARK